MKKFHGNENSITKFCYWIRTEMKISSDEIIIRLGTIDDEKITEFTDVGIEFIQIIYVWLES